VFVPRLGTADALIAKFGGDFPPVAPGRRLQLSP